MLKAMRVALNSVLLLTNLNILIGQSLVTSRITYPTASRKSVLTSPSSTVLLSSNHHVVTSATTTPSSAGGGTTVTSTGIFSTLVSPTKSIPTSSSVLTTTSGKVIDPEGINHGLKEHLKFSTNGYIKTNISTGLSDRKSTNFIQLSNDVKEKLRNALTGIGYIESYIIRFQKNIKYIIFDATLYINTTSIPFGKTNITKTFENDVTIFDVTAKEICVKNTCSGLLNGRCDPNEAKIICSCNPGFRGSRCEIKYPVNGTKYGPWSPWTKCTLECESGIRKRFSWCSPIPKHGGICVLKPMNLIINESCNTQPCPREHEDEDYYLVAYICGGVLLAIIILILAFCCTHQYAIATTSKEDRDDQMSANSSKDHKVSYMHHSNLNSKPSSKSYSTHSPYVRKVSDVPLQILDSKLILNTSDQNSGIDNIAYTDQYNKFKLQEQTSSNDSGFHNIGYRENDDNDSEENDSEEIYREQINKFLQKAPDIRHNMVVPRSPRLHVNHIERSPQFIQCSKTTTSSPVPKYRPSNRPPWLNDRGSFRGNNVDIDKNIVDHGPSKYKLVMI